MSYYFYFIGYCSKTIIPTSSATISNHTSNRILYVISGSRYAIYSNTIHVLTITKGSRFSTSLTSFKLESCTSTPKTITSLVRNQIITLT